MPEFIEVPIIVALFLPIFSWWNNRFHTLLFRLLHNALRIIAPICQEIVRCNTCHQWQSLLAISIGTLCNNDSDRHTMRIHGQVYLGIEPPFVRLISWLPPFAPVAWGCTLQWLASIINHSKSDSSITIWRSVSHRPLSLQRLKRLWVFFQSP